MIVFSISWSPKERFFRDMQEAREPWRTVPDEKPLVAYESDRNNT